MEKTEQQKKDEMYMRRCLQLARNGIVGAAPNPMVGAVIVHEDCIIGEGYHRKCGGPHAEVNAIRSVNRPEWLPESTIYVSLEPCAHYGKTPPCADLIIAKRIPRVVVGCRDSFSKVDGKGIEKLRNAGVEVTVGVLEQECLRLNERFFTQHTKHRPFVTLKWAQSEDGYLDRQRCKDEAGSPVVFSTPLTRALVHRLRAQSDAILVGARTAIMDNPSLTVRHWSGRSPLRLVVDPNGRLPQHLRLFDGEAPTCVYVLAGKQPAYAGKTEIVWLQEGEICEQIVSHLSSRNVQSLLVEGGAETLQHFVDSGLWDEARVEVSPQRLACGVKVPKLGESQLAAEETVDGNVIRRYRPKI